jgi:Fe-S oxidoreductase
MNASQRNEIRNGALNVLCESNPDVLVTACPLCKKTFDSANGIAVKDIAELVAAQITTTPERSKKPEMAAAEIATL